MKTPKHKWIFTTRFRARTFGWRSSSLASQRIKEAVSEIKKVAKKDPVLGAEGVVKFSEKLWPALEQIDTSSGALGTAVYNALHTLLPILADAPADQKTREKWLDRLWQAIEEDGVDYLSPITDNWGKVCGSAEVASLWADNDMISIVKSVWKEPGSFFRGSTACLSCLLTAGRYEELLELLEHDPLKFWSYRSYGVNALLAMGKKAQAIEYAESCRNSSYPDYLIDKVCEDILISSGLYDEAYKRYALGKNITSTYLAHFREIAKCYHMKDKEEILRDLIAKTPGEEGKWFAAAKDTGCFDLAVELANISFCDPKTLNRAAKKYQDKNPKFSLGASLASLKWMSHGYGYEITGVDVLDAYDQAMQAAERLGISEKVKDDISRIVYNNHSSAGLLQRILGAQLEAPPPN